MESLRDSRLKSLTILTLSLQLKRALSESGLKSLTIPTTLTIIGDYAFSESGLTSLTFEKEEKSYG